MAAPTAGFLAERLAKAEAVPAEQRSADVRAFIETCRLQAELVEELGLPEVVDVNVVKGLRSRDRLTTWSAARSLKLVRSCFVSLSGPLMHTEQLHQLALCNVYMRTSSRRTGTFPPDMPELTELLEGDPSLETFAVLAAGLPAAETGSGLARGAPCLHNTTTLWYCKLLQDTVLCCLRAGLLKVLNSAVALMRQPAVRRRLQSELAALPHQLVTYEELLAFYIEYAGRKAMELIAENDTGASYREEDIMAAMQLGAPAAAGARQPAPPLYSCIYVQKRSTG